MTTPITLDVPHKLGRAEAKRRVTEGLVKLPNYIPGNAEIASTWADDRLDLTVRTLGQTVVCTLDIRETLVHVEAMLPGMLGMFAGAISGALKEKGGKLLEDKRE